MIIRYLFIVVISVVVWSCTTDYKSIFNGENLDGWQIHGAGKWYVEDGALVCESGKGEDVGYLSTLENYYDFELVFEFKQEEMKNNFGVLFHTTINNSDSLGWEVLIAQLNHGTGSIFEQNGRGWLVHIPEQNEKILKENDWNKLKIKVEGGHVTTWLNGYVMVNYADSKIAEGRGGISFQIHKGGGVKIKLRNIKIKRLDELEKVNQYF